MQRMTVDLPAPEGPISAITSPSGEVKVDAFERQVAGPVALRQPLDPKHSLGARSGAIDYLQVYLTPVASSILRMTLQSFL